MKRGFRRGSTATQVALLLPVLIGMSALAVDSGWARTTQAELRNGAESAALAGAAYLYDDDSSLVVSTAIGVAAMNEAGGAPVVLDGADVRVGTWDADTATWTDDADGDFVRVEAHIDALPLFLAGVIGFDTLAINAVSIAGREESVTTVGGGDFPCLMFGDTSLDLSGTASVDAYDSTAGAYSGSSGSAGVCSNAEEVTVRGTADILGDVHPGVGGSVRRLGRAHYISGSTEPLEEEIELTPVEAPTTWNNHGVPSSVTSSMSMPTDTYYFDSGWSVSATAELRVDEPVVVYVDGDVTINGSGLLNSSADPHLLKIYVIGSGTVTINGNSTFYGTVYAPEADIVLNGTADFYGALVGGTLRHNGTGDIHLDNSLAEAIGEVATTEVVVSHGAPMVFY